jgi:hypothetical protein
MEIRTCPIKYIDLHHTAGNEKNTAVVRQEHLNLGWGDIGYNVVIEKDGTVGIGRDTKYVGAHDLGLSPDGIHSMNQAAYAISHIGNFMLETMNETQFMSSVKHCAQKCKQFGIEPLMTTIKRHKDQYVTDCPGDNFPYERYINEVIFLMKGNKTMEEGILIFGPDDFVPAQRLAATLNNEVAIFMRKGDGSSPAAIKTVKHLFVVGGGEVNHPNQTILAGADWFATVAAVGKRIGK